MQVHCLLKIGPDKLPKAPLTGNTAPAGYQLRSLLVHETFKKVLYISPAVRGEFSSGRVFNLVTSDAETLQLLTQNIMGLISSPLRIIVAVLMLYLELGVSSLVAIGVLVMLMPTQVRFRQESQPSSLCHAWLKLALKHHWQCFAAPSHHCSHAHALPGAGRQLSRGSWHPHNAHANTGTALAVNHSLPFCIVFQLSSPLILLKGSHLTWDLGMH